MTTYGSLFSGVGGFDLGCDAAGWECAWQVEVDARCRAVLRRHWVNSDLYDDVRTVNGCDIEPVDVITYGFPCQDLSVAGKRAGLDGERSGLFFEAIRIINEMREATNGQFPRVAVAENVMGLLNADKGDAMGRCLDALAESGALAIEWRVLDAQWFGVPQRRRRVFLVAVFDPRAAGRGPVFPEPSSVRGNPATRNQAGQAVAGTLGGGAGERGWACDTDRMTFIPVEPLPRVVGTVAAGAHPGGANGQDAYTGHLIPGTVGALTTRIEADRAPAVDSGHSLPTVAGTLTTAFGAKNYSNIQEVLSGSIVPATRESPVVSGAVVASWANGPGNAQAEGGLIVPATQSFVKAKRAQSVDDDESWKEGGVSPTLNGFDNNGDTRATVLHTFAFQPDDQASGTGALRAVPTDVAPTIGCGNHHSDRGLRVLEQATTLGVRRLTPRECERLMGWPDDHTRYAADGTEIADSSRYRMCGNGVAAPVAKYVAECVEAILNG